MTCSDGSSLRGPGNTSSSVASPSTAAAGDWANDTYWLSGACLLRLAVFTAGEVLRGVESSAKVREVESPAGREARIAFLKATSPPRVRSSPSPPSRKEHD